MAKVIINDELKRFAGWICHNQYVSSVDGISSVFWGQL